MIKNSLLLCNINDRECVVFCMMDYILKKVSYEDASKVFNLLQYARNCRSEYVQNKIKDDRIYEYRWFESRFNEQNRDTYLILDTRYNLMGFVMVNSETKVIEKGHRLSELLILPQFRRLFLGQRVCQDVFQMYQGEWEVEPIYEDLRSYYFFKRAIEYYTNRVCTYMKKTFVFKK